MAKHKQVVFKSYSPGQALLLPPSLEELIAASHPVRVVNQVIDAVNLQHLQEAYKGGGTSSYHPRLLLKILVYGYVSNIYSSRKLEAACKESIPFMWLTGMQQPDHNTINTFRGKRLQHTLKNIFTQIVLLLSGEGLLSIKDIYTDGTKIEANANRYTFVWGKSIATSKEKIKQQLDELWQYAQSIATTEAATPPTPPDDTTPISKEKVAAAIGQIEAVLSSSSPEKVSKTVKQKLAYAKKNWPAALDKYAIQEEVLAGRNSYSKTDTDATFMRLKDDHMQNGQLKAAYNVQISTSNQFIVNYSLHPNPTDTTTLLPHLLAHKEAYGSLPDSCTADAGYGSEENYQYLQDNGVEGFVKYSSFHRQQRTTYVDKHPFAAEQLHYNKKQDCYYCPMGQTMRCTGTHKRKTTTGFEQTITTYQARRCEGCPLRGVCHRGQGPRIIEINHNLNRLKAIAKAKLTSEAGVAKRKQRCRDVEPVFGNIKNNHHFTRFLLRGKEKVGVETGLLALAQNVRKKVAAMAAKEAKKSLFQPFAGYQTQGRMAA